MKHYEDSSQASPQRLIDAFGSFPKAIDAIMKFERVAWEFSFLSDIPSKDVVWPEGKYFRINLSQLRERQFSEEFLLIIFDRLVAKNLCRIDEDKIGLNLNIFQPFALERILLEDTRPDNDLRYYVMRNVRQHYTCDFTPDIAHLFQILATSLNSHRPPRDPKRKRGEINEGPKYTWDYEKEFLPFLTRILDQDKWHTHKVERDVNLFIECCRLVGYLLPYYEGGHIDIRTSNIDAAFLLSNLFGVPTQMRGFDELLGGGGLIFPEKLGRANSLSLGGRAVLIKGRFGTGKSLLSLQLAVEVARKGGVAWVMPLEQSAEECLYILETMGALRYDGSMAIATDVLAAAEILDSSKDDCGALIILKTIKDTYDDFLHALLENVARLRTYSLRLICVDPINSVRREKLSSSDLRSETLKALDELKRRGTNIIMVAEGQDDSTPKDGDLPFEENIADTVIHLSVKKQHGYAARYFEVQKSRLQREQRGLHPFSIVPGAGFRIFPSSAAVNARMRTRGVSKHQDEIRFGMPALDDILGQGAITAGDVIAFQGAGGSFKTPLGLLFLLGSDHKQGRRNQLPLRSLLLSARDSEASITHMLNQPFVSQHISSVKAHNPVQASVHKTIRDIVICSLPPGYIHPGQVLQKIEDEITDARLNNYWIDRVMVDDIAHWDMSSPFIREDRTFGDTLIDFLRRFGVTSLLICGQVQHDPLHVVQRSIIDGSDCLIQFDRIEFRGTHHVMLQVLKTRGMRHRGESFEVTLGPSALDIKPTSSLLRVVSGEIRPVRIRLFLNSRSELKSLYNNRIIESIRSVLSQDAKIESQERLNKNKVLELGMLSAVDELQILQLDEFQLPQPLDRSDSNFILHKFAPSQWEEGEWADFFPRLRDRARMDDGTFFAIPYYENLSLLAYRRDLVGIIPSSLSWKELAEECQAWEQSQKDAKAIFFDCPKGSAENYNSLFLEILFQLAPDSPTGVGCRLHWLFSQWEAIEASKIFRQLCRRSYLASGENLVAVHQMQNNAPPIEADTNAVVWRHWYTSLNQMLLKMDRSNRRNISISPLPGGICTAGEWYCGVTAYSAAPDVGLEIIKLLTSHDAELDRLQSGIGLPTRSTFYRNSLNSESTAMSISPFVSIELGVLNEMLKKPIRRSDIGCYSQFSNVLAHHLQMIIAIPEGSEDSIESNIKSIFNSIRRRIEFMDSNHTCKKCPLNNTAG